jgi:hypothetical protein
MGCRFWFFNLLMISFWNFHLAAQFIERFNLDPNDSSRNYYIAVTPFSNQPKALLVLLDGFGANARDVLEETDIPYNAAKNNILTIIPVLKTGSTYFGTDDLSQASLKQIIELSLLKYNMQDKPLFIGGFSIGGTCALKYTELANELEYSKKPDAVFCIDAPLDWERFCKGAERTVRLSGNRGVGDLIYIMNKIKVEMKGTPYEVIENYYKQSPYSYSDHSQRAIKSLLNTKVMMVTEPDIDWWIKERGYDYSYINSPDHAAMINELVRLGNKNAILITTENKGYRKPKNNRHPHSWSIMDQEFLFKWLFQP